MPCSGGYQCACSTTSTLINTWSSCCVCWMPGWAVAGVVRSFPWRFGRTTMRPLGHSGRTAYVGAWALSWSNFLKYGTNEKLGEVKWGHARCRSFVWGGCMIKTHVLWFFWAMMVSVTLNYNRVKKSMQFLRSGKMTNGCLAPSSRCFHSSNAKFTFAHVIGLLCLG